MLWLLITIISYFFLALVNVVDKFLLDNVLPNTKAYAFVVGSLGMAVFLVAPWFLLWPGLLGLLVNLVVGAFFPIALLLLYKALKEGEASRVLVIIGGFLPILSLVLSILLLGESFKQTQWIALALLIMGTVIISWMPQKHNFWHKVLTTLKIKKDIPRKGLITALLCALFLALFFVGTKYAYNTQDFFSSFIWIRLGSFIAVLFLLVKRKNRQEIFSSLGKLSPKNKVFFLSNQSLAAIGFGLQNYAISLTSVVIVNALQGVQYVFVLLLGVGFTLFYPKALKENISAWIIIQKAIAIGLISLGLYFVTI